MWDGTAGEDGRAVTSQEKEAGRGDPGRNGGVAQMGRAWGSVETHKLWAATVEAIAVQVAVPIAGHENAPQLPIPSCVECVI